MSGTVPIPKDAKSLLAKVDAHLKNAKSWGPKEWLEQITTLRRLSVENNLGLHEPDPNTFDLPSGVGQVGLPPVSLIPSRKNAYSISAEWLPALVVNLNAPDECILEAVRRRLIQRSRSSKLIRKPGRGSLSRSLNKFTFNKWRSNQIVELAELLAWRAALNAQGKKAYSERALGDWLGKDRSQTNKAKNELKRAIANLPALFAQTLDT